MDTGPAICARTIFVTVDRVTPKLIEGLGEALRDGYEDWVVIPVRQRPLVGKSFRVTVVPK